MVTRECIVCGKLFLGRPNSNVCSGACRLESKRRYMAKYREENSEKIAEDKRKWYFRKKGAAFVPKPKPKVEAAQPKGEALDIILEKNTNGYFIAHSAKAICKDSRWGRKYLKRDRLEQIVMLSAELSQHGIARISYGYLSAMWTYEPRRYLNLLKAVVDAKEASL